MGAATALSERGEGFEIGCSYGAIELPLEAADVAEALRIADQRMYAQKNAGRTSASRQSKDVLLRALAERNPYLRSHLGGVADLAEATALRLQLSHDEVEQVRHAAELHDVGKVAVPDAILTKPGPLDEEEWAFIRRHTIIGERIIGAAPALIARRRARAAQPRALGRPRLSRRAARARTSRSARGSSRSPTRSTAMTSPRPYSPARTPEEALEELERCAGTQFDPAVVEAFTVAWRDRTLAAWLPAAALLASRPWAASTTASTSTSVSGSRARRCSSSGPRPAPTTRHVNVSPKGPIGTLRVLDDHTIAYLDVVGSGAETIAHLRENGRIVVMLCAFEGPPRILRLHGRGRVLVPEDAEFGGARSSAPRSTSRPRPRRAARSSSSTSSGSPTPAATACR